MNSFKGIALILIAAGVIGLAYGGFTYTRDSQTTKLGPLELTVKDQRHVNIPVWAGVIAIVLGAGLLVAAAIVAAVMLRRRNRRAPGGPIPVEPPASVPGGVPSPPAPAQAVPPSRAPDQPVDMPPPEQPVEPHRPECFADQRSSPSGHELLVDGGLTINGSVGHART